MKDIKFSDSEGNKLLGTLSIPKQAKSIVIMSHGFSSSKDSKTYTELQSELNKRNIGTFRYDCYGHGILYCKNSKYSVKKDITLSKAVKSLKAAIDLISKKGNYKIGLLGSSFGGLMSLIAASQDKKISALILKSPVTEPISFWKNRLSEKIIKNWKKEGVLHYKDHGENFELSYDFWEDILKFDTIKIAKNISCPTLIVHGDKDLVVPIFQSQNIAKIIRVNVKKIHGAEHSYSSPSNYKEMKKTIINFLVNSLQKNS